MLIKKISPGNVKEVEYKILVASKQNEFNL